MESISVTTYRGFSTVNGETTLAQDMADIKNGKYARLIIKIASLVIQGTEEANNVKKQLPFRTLTANYRERRLAYGIIRYNPIITLDLDELEEDRLEAIRSLINNDPNTLGSFLSPKRHGYKIFVFRQTEYACRLRAELLQGEIDYGCLEEVHSKLYNDAKQYYEALLGTDIAATNRTIGSPHHRSRKRSEKTAGKKTCRHRGVSPHRSFSPARSRALGETAILQSGDRRKTQHEIQKGKP